MLDAFEVQIIGLWSAFSLLAGFWLIGAAAGDVWWVRGIEARGMTLERLAPEGGRS